MFWRPKRMHIPNAEDDEVEAFLDGDINVLEAFCGVTIARGWLFTYGGAPSGSPTCDTCAVAAGWEWDEVLQDWEPPALEQAG